MITVESQLHGYLQGHQLLAASVTLPKTDQSVIERLSDVAGPLRTGETFEPYLTAYPLPSGTYYVLAKTWQDLTVKRAGCVRTLSLLIPSDSWATALSLEPFLKLLALDSIPTKAERFEVSTPEARELPPTPNFRGSELLEALFLEDQKPVAVLGAQASELIAIRILTALWPSIRKRFSVSAFALSPRRIEGRDFNLVFAPKDAKSKFADWPGRRIDGGTGQLDRHRWTGTIVNRVFKEPVPRLLSENEIRLIGSQDSDAGTALRIALLWDELLVKLNYTPSAALGLLDIANSRERLNPDVYIPLKSALADAAQRAIASLSPAEAWPFLGALARKMHGTPMASEKQSVAIAAGILTATSPEGAVALLNQPDPHGAIEELISKIAEGLSSRSRDSIENVLTQAQPSTLVRLLAASPTLADSAVKSASLIVQLSHVLLTLKSDEFEQAKQALLPVLTEDAQLAAAMPIFSTLSEDELLTEVRHLGSANGFSAKTFTAPLVDRASELGVTNKLRDALLEYPSNSRRDEFIFATLSPSMDDFNWLLQERRINDEISQHFIVKLLRTTNIQQFRSLLSHSSLAANILAKIPMGATDILRRAAFELKLPLPLYLDAVEKLLRTTDENNKTNLARAVLERVLSESTVGDQVEFIVELLNIIGTQISAGWAAQYGLSKDFPGQVLSRNLIAINNSSEAVRAQLVKGVADLADALEGRNELDIKTEGANALAEMLNSANKLNSRALITASLRLMPLLLRSTRQPVSSVISVIFPIIYKELAEHDSVPGVFKYFQFFDWDRCKVARRELVDAFVSSRVWTPYDLLLTASLCPDGDRILGRTARTSRGKEIIDQMKHDLSRLPTHIQEKAERNIKNLHYE